MRGGRGVVGEGEIKEESSATHLMLAVLQDSVDPMGHSVLCCHRISNTDCEPFIHSTAQCLADFHQTACTT